MNKLGIAILIIMIIIGGGYMHSASAADTVNINSLDAVVFAALNFAVI